MGAGERFSQTIPKDQLGDTAQWELRPLAGGRRVGDSMPLSARAGDADRLKDGYEVGKAKGYADALRSAQQSRAADLQRLETLLAGFRTEFDDLAGCTADVLLDLAIDIAAQVLRQEVQTRPEVILPVVREALALIEGTHAHPTVHLAPVDFELVRAAVQADGHFQGCRFVSDSSVDPGGCRIESASGQIDATLPTRWRRVIQTLGASVPLADAEPDVAPATRSTPSGTDAEGS
jgi:flagellar assembly protein FliH